MSPSIVELPGRSTITIRSIGGLQLRRYFPQLVRSTRFVERMPKCWSPCGVLCLPGKAHRTGIAFIDSPPVAGCHTIRMATHKV